MAKKRMIDSKFWSDSYIVTLNKIERYLFLYFLTNEHTNVLGIYELPIRTICFETDFEEDELLPILAKFEKDQRIYYFDGFVVIKNFVKNQNVKSRKDRIYLGMVAALKNLPKNIWLEINKNKDLKGAYKDLISSSRQYNTNTNTNTNTNLNFNLNSLSQNFVCDDMDFKKFKKIVDDTGQRYLGIIADFAEEKKIELKTGQQWWDFMERNSKPSKKLEKYDDEQISKATRKTKKESEAKSFDWTLETVFKNLMK